MVFNPFRVCLGNRFGHSEAAEEIHHNVMAPPRCLGQPCPFVGEENPADMMDYDYDYDYDQSYPNTPEKVKFARTA